MRFLPFFVPFVLFLLPASPMLAARHELAPAEEIVVRSILAIAPVGRYGRNALHTDAIESMIVNGNWTAPKAGQTVTLPGGSTRAWESLTADKDGVFESRLLEGGYAFATVNSDVEKVMLLEASGHNMVYVNGEPRAGDPYQYGYLSLPVHLHAGANELLFLSGRGSLRIKLVAPRAPFQIDARDSTLPDLVTGEKTAVWAAVWVTNTQSKPSENLAIEARLPDSSSRRTILPAILPIGARKVGFQIPGKAFSASGDTKLELTLLHKEGGSWKPLDTTTVGLRIRPPLQTQKRTFVSGIDGSVQYYAVNPVQPLSKDAPPPALILSLHGASVEAIGQADAYSSKTWATLIAPTNRRPYGFDWEEWGRQDALEVLALAEKRYRYDPQRVYLTGHSMGGHGTWQIGATFPDLFAAIGPSAGWISFFSYAGSSREVSPSPLRALLQRASNPSDTLSLIQNYAHHGVYILHGGADDNVPVTEAREMHDRLSKFHRDLGYYEQPGAGHWWDASPEPGADCVDWAPMQDFFTRHALQSDAQIRQVDFTTASPGISAKSHWATIEAQEKLLAPAAVHLRCDPGLRKFTGTTENVARLSLSTAHLAAGKPVSLELDGQKLDNLPWPKSEPRLWLAKEGGKWAVVAKFGPEQKGPERYGPFKEAFRNRFEFVYGTTGTPEENAWSFAKARYDAETFGYRGNGSVDVLADTAFDAKRDRDRAVIVYGNADTNAAWKTLLADSPVQVRRGSAKIGDREIAGNNTACLFVRPRSGSSVACVGVVSGTGLPGLRLTERIPVFLSGVAYPDVLAMTTDVLSGEIAGVRAAGFFGLDWSVEKGEFAWGEPTQAK